MSKESITAPGPSYRPLGPDDTHAQYGVFRRAIADLLERQGQSWPWDEHDDAEWQRWRPLFEHLRRTADRSWGAFVDGRLVGYARSIHRSDWRELTEFFVAPEARGRGIGRELLTRAFPADDVRHRTILATSDPAAISRYLRYGFRSHGVMFSFVGAPSTDIPTGSRAASPPRRGRPCYGSRGRSPAEPTHGLPELRPVGEPAPQLLDTLAAIDDQVLGIRRDEDHRWLLDTRDGFLVQRDGATVGYGYGGERQGPIALLDPADMPVVLASLERHAAGQGVDEISFETPLANVHAVDHLLGRGFRIDPFTVHLLGDRPEPVQRFERYVITSPPFFL